LIDLESSIVQPGSVPALPANWGRRLERCRQDEQLPRFLMLRPHLREIFQDELEAFFKVSQAVSPPPGVAPASRPEGTVPEPATVFTTVPSQVQSAVLAEFLRPPYKDVDIVIQLLSTPRKTILTFRSPVHYSNPKNLGRHIRSRPISRSYRGN
jgi:hypothetical protein